MNKNEENGRNITKDPAFENLVESISQLIEMQDDCNVRSAVCLYRAMFRHETDVNKLDWNYADNILEGVGFGNANAIEDYKNYLQYLKCFNMEEYLAHKRMFDEELGNLDKEDDA